ncbi:ABC transporter permease [Mucisphaera sp.]|uniref:ABC transporter permease n=1 Tax=Mucisphaera sp. TaxID=2913024 RepID=UPI003D12FE6B
MFQQFWSIALNTFAEAVRQPIYVVITLVGILLLVINPMLAAYTLENDNKLMIDLGLSTVLLAGLFLSAFSATGVLATEIENRTVLTVVSKPVSRPVFVLGKFFGVTGAIGLAFGILAAVFVLTIRHRVMQTARDDFDLPVILFGVGALLVSLGVATVGNYLYRWVFTSVLMKMLAVTLAAAFLLVLVIGKDWTLQAPWHDLTEHDGELGQTLAGLILVFQGVLVIAAVAVAASTRLGQVMTLLICFGVLVLGVTAGFLSGWVDQQVRVPVGYGTWATFGAIFEADAAAGVKAVYLGVKGMYLMLPNYQFFWPADAITQGNPFTAAYIGSVVAYGMLYVGVILGLAVALFQTREVG